MESSEDELTEVWYNQPQLEKTKEPNKLPKVDEQRNQQSDPQHDSPSPPL